MPSRIEGKNVSDLSPQCFVEEKNFFCAKRRCVCKKEIVGLGRKLSVAEQLELKQKRLQLQLQAGWGEGTIFREHLKKEKRKEKKTTRDISHELLE